MGILDRLLGRSKDNAATTALTAADAERIINAYATATIDKGSFVADVAGLPHSKSIVKTAILSVLDAQPDPPVRDRMKLLYLSLADWQAGVGPKPLPFEAPSAGGAPTAARRTAAPAGGRGDVRGRAAAEAKALRAELKTRGL